MVSARHRTSCSLCRAVRVACREGRTRIQAARSGRAARFASRFAPCPLGRTGPGRAERAGRGEVVSGRRRLRPRPVVAGGAGGGGSLLCPSVDSSFLSTCSRCPNSRSILRRQQARFRSGAVVGRSRFGQAEHLDRRALTAAENPDPWMLDAAARTDAESTSRLGRADDGACARDSQRMDTIGSPRARRGPLPAKSAAEALWGNQTPSRIAIEAGAARSRASRFARGVGALGLGHEPARLSGRSSASGRL